jgi:hypothetical protein
MTPLAVPWAGFDEQLRRVIAGGPVPGWAEIAGVMAS